MNEIKDNRPSSMMGVIGTSIGSAASIYILVSITGYLTFGNSVVGNIVSMCKFSSMPPLIAQFNTCRPHWGGFDYWQSCNCRLSTFLYSTSGTSMPCISGCCPEVAS